MDPATLRLVLTVLVATVPVLGLIILWTRSWYSFVKLAWKIPGPPLWTMLRSLPDMMDHFEEYLYQVCRSYDFKPFRLIVFGNILVPLSDPDDFAVVLKHKHLSEKPKFVYENMESLSGENLITLNGSTWKRHRHALNPGFNQQVLGAYIPLFNTRARDFVQTVRKMCTGETVDISSLLFENVLLGAVKVNLWQNIDTELYTKPNLVGFIEEFATSVRRPGISLDDIFRDLNRAIRELQKILLTSYLNPWKYYLSYPFRSDLNRIRKYFKTIIGCFYKIISARKEEVENILSKGDIDFSPSSALEHSLLLKDAGKFTLSDEELTAELLALVAAGSETTAVTLNIILALLALHPEVQDKVAEELLSIFQGSDRSATMDDLKRMEYLDCVVKETIRLFPPVPFALRVATEDVSINGTVVPKGGNVALFIWGLHRNPKYFDNPCDFRPERFISGSVEKLVQYGYVPFSAGPRGCIGSRFAMIQIKAFVSTFLRSYELRPGQGLNGVEGIKVALGFTLHVTSEVPVRLYPREWDKRL